MAVGFRNGGFPPPNQLRLLQVGVKKMPAASIQRNTRNCWRHAAGSSRHNFKPHGNFCSM
jgi:hypothetical protein